MLSQVVGRQLASSMVSRQAAGAPLQQPGQGLLALYLFLRCLLGESKHVGNLRQRIVRLFVAPMPYQANAWNCASSIGLATSMRRNSFR